MDCRLVESYEAGDHTIFVGQAEAIGIGAGDPLLYYRSGFAALKRHSGRCSLAFRVAICEPMDCRLVESYEAGDHTIFVGQAEAIGIGAGDPLLYYRSGFAALK